VIHRAASRHHRVLCGALGCRSVHRAKDGIANVKPSTLEAIIRTCKSWGLIKTEKSIADVS
jgi:hypothetical protein